MDPTADLADARLTRFLEREPVLWLSTVAADGAPSLVPTWFTWDGAHITILSKPGARKVRNLAANPRAMIGLGDAEEDFDVGMLQVRAELVGEPTPLSLPTGFSEKYGDRITDLGLTPAQFARTYAQAIRLTPVRALGWHGRNQPRSVGLAARRLAAAGRVSIMEPISAAIRPVFGEPIGRLAIS